MSTFISNLVHFVWGTADREPLLRKSWRDRMYGYIGGILAKKNCKLLAAGGMEDHMHVLASLPATISLAEAVSAMKANSSRWIHENAPQCKGFDWQTGYAAFSVSKSAQARVTEYIQNQERHHKKWKFTAEFMALLEKHGIDYEERYLWV
ncbi:MAG TPA: IS200/IS605 family transposase [Pirellulales bacterium]|nr:IS200/IS605 family transposase [Pirellulales bacterium]